MATLSPAQASPDSEIRKAILRPHLAAILVLGIIMYYLFDTATDQEVVDISRLLGMSTQDYDYFMADVDSIRYTPAGLAEYRFRANRVTHFPNPEFSIVESPRFVIYREDGSAWRIDSNTGRIETDAENRERLILSENVIISGMTADGRPVNITTESLTVYPDSRMLSTDSEVTVESEGFFSTSQGLSADLDTNVIRQFANGQMHYEQPRQGQ